MVISARHESLRAVMARVEDPYSLGSWSCMAEFRPVFENGAEPVLTIEDYKRVFCPNTCSQRICVALVLITKRILIPHTRQSCPKALRTRERQYVPSVSFPHGTAGSKGDLSYTPFLTLVQPRQNHDKTAFLFHFCTCWHSCLSTKPQSSFDSPPH